MAAPKLEMTQIKVGTVELQAILSGTGDGREGLNNDSLRYMVIRMSLGTESRKPSTGMISRAFQSFEKHAGLRL